MRVGEVMLEGLCKHLYYDFIFTCDLNGQNIRVWLIF